MNIKLRPWKLSDADFLVNTLNYPNFLNNLNDKIPFPYTKDDGLFFIKSILNAESNSIISFCIISDDIPVGAITIEVGKDIHRRTGELGYYLNNNYWGNGMIPTAVKLICDYAFENTDLVRITSEPFSRNKASCRVLEKSGFVHEATLKKSVFKNNEILDSELYVMIKQY